MEAPLHDPSDTVDIGRRATCREVVQVHSSKLVQEPQLLACALEARLMAKPGQREPKCLPLIERDLIP
jgi:hypothetical protein